VKEDGEIGWIWILEEVKDKMKKKRKNDKKNIMVFIDNSEKKLFY
jgi:hypothetical protein